MPDMWQCLYEDMATDLLMVDCSACHGHMVETRPSLQHITQLPTLQQHTWFHHQRDQHFQELWVCNQALISALGTCMWYCKWSPPEARIMPGSQQPVNHHPWFIPGTQAETGNKAFAPANSSAQLSV